MLWLLFKDENILVGRLVVNPKFAEGVILLVKEGILSKEYVRGYLKSRLDMEKIDNLTYIEILDGIK
jgi:hypothetical protein